VYVIKNDLRNAFKTYDGWTQIVRSSKSVALIGLDDVIRFTKGEADMNKDSLPKGSRFVYFPRRTWKDVRSASR
jgi:hypothetical protein